MTFGLSFYEGEKGQLPYYEADKTRRDKMVSLVERMLKLHKNLPKAKTAPEKTDDG